MASYLDICTSVLASLTDWAPARMSHKGCLWLRNHQTFTVLKPVLTQDKLIRLLSNVVQQQNINIKFLLFIWKKSNLDLQ